MITGAFAALGAAALVALAGASGAPAAAAPGASTIAFRIADPRIDEASGIAVGIASPGVVYVHNDSGDSARFFALSADTGATLATVTVPGATNVDWEDIAVAPDSRGVSSVWLADIGDNRATRSEIDIYRVDEPHVDRATTDAALASAPAQVWRLRYPDGAHDAESLAVAPTGAAYLVTKSVTGSAGVYAVPTRPDAGRLQVLRKVGSMYFGFTGTSGGPNPFGQRTATGASLSRDGALLAVRTYTDAYLWRMQRADVAAAIQAEPVRLALPAQPQGEGLTFDGTRLLLDSEGVGSTVYSLALPTSLTAAVPTVPAGAGSTTARLPTAPPSDDGYAFPFLPAAFVGIALMLACAVYIKWSISRRRRERHHAERRARRQ